MQLPSPTFLKREFDCLRQSGRGDALQTNLLFAQELNNSFPGCKNAENTHENSCKWSGDVEYKFVSFRCENAGSDL